MTENGILNWLTRWFMENAHMEEEEIKEKIASSYFELGLVDSLQFVMLISDIEQKFNIRFNNDEFQDRAFSTIHGLAGIIGRKQNEKL